MIKSNVKPIDEPRRFEPHELFFSLTDKQGRIRYGNQVFTRVSAYEQEELLGKPHNLIRHPDMPRCVFRLLWDYIQSGKTIAAYVKNLAADGRYYWVLAVAMPCRDGYLSIRLNPSSPMFTATKSLYAEVLAFESAVEADQGKQAAIEQSTVRLVEGLKKLGFDTYEDFMCSALKAELLSREVAVKANPNTQPIASGSTSAALTELLSGLAGVKRQLQNVFSSMDVFETLSQQLSSKQEAMQDLGPSLSILALNANLSATRLGDEGVVLTAVSKLLGEQSKAADQRIARLLQRMQPCCKTAQSACFEIAVSQLEAEICESFAVELAESYAQGSDDLIAESLAFLTGELTKRCQGVLDSLHALWSDTRLMNEASLELERSVSQMQFSQLNGKMDLSTRSDSANFESIFDDVSAIIVSAKQDCYEISDLLDKTVKQLRPLLEIDSKLRLDLCSVDLATTEIVSTSAEAFDTAALA